MRNMKKSFLMSIVALLLCFVMFLGTTFAWFTDSVTSSGNKIIAGTLKLDLEMLDKTTGAWYSVKESKDPIFNYEYWEPGYTNVAFLKVENEGNLALKWQARFISDAAVSKLAEVIDVYVMPSETELSYNNATRDLDGWQRVGTLDQFINTLSDTTYGYLTHEGDVAYLGIALHMQEDAGNEYQGIGLEAFDIQIVATQMSYEEDSFGPDYDNDAQWPEGEMNFSATQSLANVSIINGELAEDVIIRHESGVYAVVPAGVKLADGVTELKFSGKNVDNAGNFADDAKSYDIHIEGIHADNTTCITVYIGEILEAGLGETELKLYHEDAQMTSVESVADFQINNQFTYDSATGAVVLYVDNFSIFSGVKTTADVWNGDVSNYGYGGGLGTQSNPFMINTGAELAYFRDQVDKGQNYEGKYFKLGADIDLAGINFDPIGYGYNTYFSGTFDGGNHTIYGLKQNGWDLGYSYGTQGGGLFASVKDATIKNLAISGANIVMECVDMGIVVGYAYGTCTFENIVVTKSVIANYNRYTGGVVGEVNGNHTFTNIIVDSSVVVSSLWGSFDTAIGGVIGGKYGNATVTMTDVIVAAELDVYSDVTAAYQWYAYRRCGMLIGHTEQNSPKSALNAAANFLTCENVNVYYGDWVNYTYYQFADQKDADGNSLWYSNYPWVRAEASPVGNNGAFSNPRYGNPIVDGVSINTKALAEANQTDYTPIVFNQLYGGGQGVYGCNEHAGVTTNNKDGKTIYATNNGGWTNLKLQYWFANGDDTWTTLIDGIDMSKMLVDEANGVYKIQLPANAYAFKIVADGVESDEFVLATFENNANITLGSTPCTHETTTTVKENIVNATCTSNGSYDNVVKCLDCEAEISRETVTVAALGHKYDNACDSTCNTCGATRTVGDHKWYNTSYTCTECGKKAETKTVYFQNNWNWTDVRVYYWRSNGEYVVAWPGTEMKLDHNDGKYDIYKFEIPTYADSFNISGIKNDGSGNRDETPTIKVSDVSEDFFYYMNYNNGNEVKLSPKVVYFVPNSNWKQSSARFAVYFFNDSTGKNKWVSMTWDDTKQAYKCNVPDGQWEEMIFVRMNPAYNTNSWDANGKDYVWNQSGDLVIPSNGNNTLTMSTSGSVWDGFTTTWSKK